MMLDSAGLLDRTIKNLSFCVYCSYTCTCMNIGIYIRETKTPVTKTSLQSNERPSRVLVRALYSSMAVYYAPLGH